MIIRVGFKEARVEGRKASPLAAFHVEVCPRNDISPPRGRTSCAGDAEAYAGPKSATLDVDVVWMWMRELFLEVEVGLDQVIAWTRYGLFT